jgi:hypothetical protein
MIMTVNNIAKFDSSFATSSKWSDTIVSDFDTGVEQLCGHTEI